MTDDLGKLPWLISHSRRTLRIIWQNVAVALGVTSGPESPLPLFEAGNVSLVQGMPWSFIPTVLVPFWLIVHAILFVQIRRVAGHPRSSVRWTQQTAHAGR